ncbi:MAG: hypothetical protein VR67_03615 [Peptococcaceae bacterium BRH_c8a]|nr:MAG: hypothetical protein VR67_03615 [Peptococcaceae bacterium BRH_c8a]
MNVNFKKSKIPILWLDTFAIIRFAKILKGESLPSTEQERYVKLLDLLNKKIKEKKLICVKSEQIEEIKLGRRLIKECDDIITRLSVGNHIQPPYGIEQSQLYTFMNAYYHSLEEVELDYKTAFFRDPIVSFQTKSLLFI